ncbi:MFS transporter [Rhodococcus opacus]|uniref:MFS transporter n=1 Tax=Rhodococcus opacus TaxID=37919 RepID=UPI00211EC804|nr:MFS transporter [Rhodococcus opacus]
MAAAIVFGPSFFPSFSSIAGTLAAFATFSVSEEAFLSWGWRVPFLASAVMVPMGLVIRFTISESPDFEKIESTHRDQRLPIVTVLLENLREVLLAAGAFIGINTVGYIFMAYLLSYSTKVLGMSKTLMLLVTGSVGLAVWAAALFPLIDLRNPPVIAALFTELFSAEVRYSGASLGYQIGSVLGGGLPRQWPPRCTRTGVRRHRSPCTSPRSRCSACSASSRSRGRFAPPRSARPLRSG